MKALGSLVFCLLGINMFLWVMGASRQALPIGLVAQYGDIAGIRGLTIEGDVISERTWDSSFGYSFVISPAEQRATMHIFNHSQAWADFYWGLFDSYTRWGLPRLELTYLPMDGAQPVAVYGSGTVFFDASGNAVEQFVYHTYDEVFRVVPTIHRSLYNITTPCDQLFIYVGPGAYLVQQENFGIPLNHLVRPHLPTSASHLQLFNLEPIGDKYLAVPRAPDLFGTTAVYKIPRGFTGAAIPSPLFPITLARDKDEILGLLGLGESALLFIRRVSGLEITRIHPVTGENFTVFLPMEDGGFRQHFLCENFLVIHSTTNMLAIFDLQKEGLHLVGKFPVLQQYGQDVFPAIRDILVYNATIYMAYTIVKNPEIHLVNTKKIFVAEMDLQGQRISQAQVLTGVEDDLTPRYQRNLHTITLRRP